MLKHALNEFVGFGEGAYPQTIQGSYRERRELPARAANNFSRFLGLKNDNACT